MEEINPGKGNKPTNILVIMTDEHRASITGYGGNKIANTPNLDKLASKGVVFDNCYANSPLCVPSRLSFTAGKYISDLGTWNNQSWLPSKDTTSVASLLNESGYESFLCGKMHYDYTRRYGFTELGGNNNQFFKTGKGGESRSGFPSARREPDDCTVNSNNWKKRASRFHTRVNETGLNEDEPYADMDALEKRGLTDIFWKRALDRHVTLTTEEFLENRKESDPPFFLISGYNAPHFPLIVPKNYWKKYKGKVPLPNIPSDHLASQPRNYRHLRKGFGLVNISSVEERKGRELYYGLVEWVDNEIGKVLSTLRGSKFAENTIVIYLSDHGENMGEHGLWWKNCMYDTAVKVPLIIQVPGLSLSKGDNGRREQVCSILDLSFTIAEIGGANIPKDWAGSSLMPLLGEPATQWRNLAVSEYYAHNITSGFSMLRNGRYKYVYHTPPNKNYPAERELYDLKEDPKEFCNLAEIAQYRGTLKKMHGKLLGELGKDPDESELKCREDYASGYDRNIDNLRGKS